MKAGPGLLVRGRCVAPSSLERKGARREDDERHLGPEDLQREGGGPIDRQTEEADRENRRRYGRQEPEAYEKPAVRHEASNERDRDAEKDTPRNAHDRDGSRRAERNVVRSDGS